VEHISNAVWPRRETSGSNGGEVTVTSLPLGVNPAASGQFFDERMGEILIYNRALSNAEMNTYRQ